MSIVKIPIMQKIYFTEEQHFSNFWFWVFLVVVFTAFLTPTVVALYSQLVLGTPEGENPESIESILIIFGILIVVYAAAIVLFKTMKLVVVVRQNGVFYRYPPFIIKERKFLREEIERFEIRKYKPIKEYRGWGIKTSLGKSDRAFSVKGYMGLQLYLKDGKYVLFGTQRGEACKRAMSKMMQKPG